MVFADQILKIQNVAEAIDVSHGSLEYDKGP